MMKVRLSVLRKKRGSAESYTQDFIYDAHSDNETVASALLSLNDREVLLDAEGNVAEKIEWECSCLQKKCGACAMVICGRPRLACDAGLSEFAGRVITLSPLKKFPVVCDLVVDRSILFENLKTLKLWLSGDAALGDKCLELAHEASGCIQCGCCLEICPNFYVGGTFCGMAAVPVATRLLSEMPDKEAKEIAKLYEKHVFEVNGENYGKRI